MNVLSLFSGIGGLDLGLERAGMRIVGQVEREEIRRSVLRRHFPKVPQHDEVATALEWWQSRRRPNVQVICGGFPCQPFSVAGKKGSTDDIRWQWPIMADVVGGIRPEYVVMENVAAIVTHRRAIGRLLGDLAELGFDAQWTLLSACAFGAPHMRQRLFIVAHTNRQHGQPRLGSGSKWALQTVEQRRGPWDRSRVGALDAARRPDRVPHGIAKAMVTAGGDAVVPAVAEHIGRCIIATSKKRVMRGNP